MFKDGGKGGKAEVGFPCFPQARISTAPLLLCFGSFLLPLESPSKAIRFSSGFEDVRSIGDAIQQGFTKPRIRNDLRPFREG